ncbi:BTB/POZ and MATH domain-containing protein 3 [Sorghum bicolor]|uniref:BTB domain-containing protein n=1 Tax=Sorghum bicolor TaxID=4558 RepID=C5Y9H7_SORBI|nr:BTB/POZ and MATH domain-containing protein 3 [Sorghum bicolor]EES12998.1 hypothetical protein SORBI_3006G246800 [Sorghum bicolor]|eukprot:XP_002448670.1 BTB/POZ and MATH domain-containing protein 3 [Sorghum bicolor]
MACDPSVRGYHILKVDGYSRTRSISKYSVAPGFESGPFRVGGHTWIIGYYPRGRSYSGPTYKGFISFCLYLVDPVADQSVKVRATFSFLDHDMKLKLYSRPPTTFTFSEQLGWHGYQTLVAKTALANKCLKHDCFALRVDLLIIKEEGEPSSSIALPPSDMHLHLGDLLSSKEHTDVEFHVGEETFAAHRLLLGARSAIFKAELSAGDRKTTRVIQVDDMDPQVFRAMLTFIYTDTWPKLQKDSAMAQQLLVAADRYGLQRLKSMCEYKLCKRIDLDSVEDILLLAEKHQCAALKEACFDFIGSTATLLSARESMLTLRRSQELRFNRLVSLCPTITKDKIFNVLDHEPDRNSVIRGINITLDIE